MSLNASASPVLDTAPPTASNARRPIAARPSQAGSLPRSARIVLALLERIQHGQLTLATPDGQTRQFGQGGPHALLQINDWRVCQAVLRKGDIGFAQSWIEGDWQTDHLARLLELFARNRDGIERALYGSLLGGILYRIRHWLRRNHRAGSRRNIHAHYDLGNAFYSQWLDPSMSYSGALFDGDPHRSLEAAQIAKYERILDLLGLPQGAHILEIGCGWGAFAECAARRGLHVTGLTLSTEQKAGAETRLRAAGLDHQVCVALRDYRDEHGRYDAVVSIEMFEAVGEAYWPTYFQSLARQLKPGARALMHTTVIANHLFARYRRSTDFIQQYIFPGGMLPSCDAFENGARAAGLTVTHRGSMGVDYARTLQLWRAQFLAAWPHIAPLGFDTRFARTWEFYLAYCEAGFASGNTDLMYYMLELPHSA
jgi:cyclopropane-fatty-acyl-phospholipid synthase